MVRPYNPAVHLWKGTIEERVARLIWMIESGTEADWNRYIDGYRARAREAVGHADGYVMAAEHFAAGKWSTPAPPGYVEPE